MDADGSDVAQITANSDVKDMDPDWQPLPPKSPSVTVYPPDTGGPSLLLVASALLFSGGVLLYAGRNAGCSSQLTRCTSENLISTSFGE